MKRIVVSLMLAACGAKHDAGEPPPDAGAPPVDASCGQKLDVQREQPDVMIALDRSCSMTKVLDGTSETKWQAAVASVTTATSANAQAIRWGMTLFPDTSGDACAQTDIQVPIGDATAATVNAMLTAALDASDPLFPSNPCSTNIDTGLETAATDPGLADPQHPGSVVLVTDGKQSKACTLGGGDTGTEAAVQALQQRGVITYVIGFGSEVDTVELDKLATLGGAPLSGAHAYYQADTAGDLDAAIANITAAVVSCTYHVDPAPTDLSKTYVVFDNQTLVPRDPAHMSGWDFDPTTEQLTLYGAYCDELADGTTTTIDVEFGCPEPPLL